MSTGSNQWKRLRSGASRFAKAFQFPVSFTYDRVQADDGRSLWHVEVFAHFEDVVGLWLKYRQSIESDCLGHVDLEFHHRLRALRDLVVGAAGDAAEPEGTHGEHADAPAPDAVEHDNAQGEHNHTEETLFVALLFALSLGVGALALHRFSNPVARVFWFKKGAPLQLGLWGAEFLRGLIVDRRLQIPSRDLPEDPFHRPLMNDALTAQRSGISPEGHHRTQLPVIALRIPEGFLRRRSTRSTPQQSPPGNPPQLAAPAHIGGRTRRDSNPGPSA